MDWVIKALKNGSMPKKRNERNSYVREARRLKYCESCKRVWEKTLGYRHISYGHLPTYGLPRVTCRICEEDKKEISI